MLKHLYHFLLFCQMLEETRDELKGGSLCDVAYHQVITPGGKLRKSAHQYFITQTVVANPSMYCWVGSMRIKGEKPL